jgi:hypothetical protein|tara:strand:- start:2426 stop:2650 length:225 start_codon:yes stop_codon:yes gene_type:complete
MEKIKEIRTKEENINAFDVIMRCKELARQIDLSNIILDNTSIDEKEMLINIIEGIRSLELEIVGFEPFKPEAQA